MGAPKGRALVGNGGWFYLFCALAGKASGRYGYCNLDELCPAGNCSVSESMSWMKIIGTLLTISGVALLSWEQK